MKKSWLDSGRLETVLALVVLAASVALFVKFYQPATGAVPEPTEIQTPAASSTSHP